MKKIFILLLFIPVLVFAEPLYSPSWGFHIDLPEGYAYIDGDGKDRFSFLGPEGLMFEMIVYNGRYNSMLELVNDVNRRLSNKGDADFFQYRDKNAVVMTLNFGENSGWALAVELAGNAQRPMLLALSYAPADKKHLELFHLSALDSICPTSDDRRYPGPIMEYSYPRGQARSTPLALKGLNALIRENDAEAAQVLIEREFLICEAYLNTPYLQAACIRYYRFVYRDSYDRVADAVSAIAKYFNGHTIKNDAEKRAFAQNVLSFIQGFKYERFTTPSDFLNLVSAVTEGRGDCDSHSVLFALILANADIRSGIMLSHFYSHAMALADVPGAGARIEAHGTQWLVAETTAKIDIGLIDRDQSNTNHWFAVVFE